MITVLVLLHTLCGLHLVSPTEALCGASIRWSHHVNIEYVYGMWYGVGYAQHTPDRTDKPKDIGCVTLYITEADDIRDDWLDWSLPKRNYEQNWRSYRNNPYSDTPLSGSWLDTRIRFKRQANKDIPLNREERTSPNRTARNNFIENGYVSLSRAKRDGRVKRDMYGERRLKVTWDEDGQSMEQTYVYSKDVPGLWTVEKWRPMEREMRSRGMDLWYPDNPPRHPEVIRVLKITPDQLVINHCSDSGGGGIFTLVLRRSPNRVGHWEWLEFQKQFYSYELPLVHRKAPVCAACLPVFSEIVIVICGIVWKFL